jgi:hypothetical protein
MDPLTAQAFYELWLTVLYTSLCTRIFGKYSFLSNYFLCEHERLKSSWIQAEVFLSAIAVREETEALLGKRHCFYR